MKMKLSVDFSQLHNAVRVMGAQESDFKLGFAVKDINPIDAALKEGQELGKDIDLSQIKNTNGVLSYEGRQVMLYIPDQGDDIQFVLNDGKQGRRIHVAECNTLQLMRETGRFPRYKVTNDINGHVPVYGVDPETGLEVEGKSHLGTCMNCLRILNYQGYALKPKHEKTVIFNNFNFIKFFETYSSYFKSLPISDSNDYSSTYTADWPVISAELKKQVSYMCEQCGVDLDSEKRLLHVHHIDGVKSNNHGDNLRVLCADCHKKQPHHGHLYIQPTDVIRINVLRREQHKFDSSDYTQLINCADTALEGLLLKCKNTRLALGELGIAINCGGQSIIPIDLCWPRKKVAVLLNVENEENIKKQGWTVFSATNALEDFQNFQRYVR